MEKGLIEKQVVISSYYNLVMMWQTV